MKKMMISAVLFLCMFELSAVQKEAPLNVLNIQQVFSIPYPPIFLHKRAIDSSLRTLWQKSIDVVSNFVTGHSDYNNALMQAMRMVEQVGTQVIAVVDHVRNVGPVLKTLPQNEKIMQKRQIQHKLDEMATQLFFAQEKIKNSFKKQNQDIARRTLLAFINYLKNPVLSDVSTELSLI